MASINSELTSRPCADIPEFERFRTQEYRREALMQQTGGGEAFVEAAAPVIRKNVLQALPYASETGKYVHALQRNGVSGEILERSLARAWLDASEHFLVPKPRKRDLFYGTPALLCYSAVIVIALLLGAIKVMRHTHPELIEIVLAAPPILAIVGVPLLVVVFAALRTLVHRA
ncbi:MAG: hypothetical protein V4787_01850 [Pseudomonadota bacterium]